MHLLARSSSSRAFAIAFALCLAACIDAPQLASVGQSTPATSDDPARGGGGESAISRERDGMVLIPDVTVDAAGGLAPVNEDPIPHAKPEDKRGKGEGKGGGNGGGAMDGGGGTTPPPPATPPGTTPAHVAVPAFWLDVTEVSVAAYRRCLEAGACSAPATGAGCTLSEGLDAHPVTCVSVDQARAFCTWSNKRFVRADEFTSAAAGSTHRTYPWGTEAPAADRVNACGAECSPSGMYSGADGFVRTAPAGSFASGKSPDGVYDLAGNVAEWVDGLVPVARGGSYADVDASAVSATHPEVGAAAGPTIGFRCAADR